MLYSLLLVVCLSDAGELYEYGIGLLQVGILAGAFFIAKVYVTIKFAILISFGVLFVIYVIAIIVYSVYQYYHTL